MRYAVVIENAGSNFSAYVPDLPACVATGATLAETEAAIREAIEFLRAGELGEFSGRPVAREHGHGTALAGPGVDVAAAQVKQCAAPAGIRSARGSPKHPLGGEVVS